MTNFQADVFQNEFLPEGADVVDAVVTVTSAGGQGASGATVTSRERVEVIVIDCSGSMNEDGGSKIRAARQATMTAIDTLTDGTLFAVVAGVDGAYALYPPNSGVERVNPQTREQAKQIVSQVRAKGGTAIGSWLLAAGGLFNLVPDSINHCILLTDGKNQSESDRVLNGAIQA
ncbi:MAG: VWA domain-containing protein, partial [Acidimicrobiales bacterium]